MILTEKRIALHWRRIARSCELTRTGHNVLVVAGFSDDAGRKATMLRVLNV